MFAKIRKFLEMRALRASLDRSIEMAELAAWDLRHGRRSRREAECILMCMRDDVEMFREAGLDVLPLAWACVELEHVLAEERLTWKRC
jgi:hypothetical protein